MTRSTHAGARILFRRGAAVVVPPVSVPPGWSTACYSVVSPGTELRRLAATVNGADHEAGYMTIVGRPSGDQLLIPVPHGAAAAPRDPRGLPVPQGARAEHVAAARFQVMAALGLDSWVAHCRTHRTVLVLGGGPVAVGCALELARLGVAQVEVVTQHPRPALATLPGVTVLAEPPRAASQPIVIDCTGRAAQALTLTAPGGLLGLLGTPATEADLSAAAVHRHGAVVAGMHELAGHDGEMRRAMFQTALRWVTATVDPDGAPGWFARIPGEQAGPFYAALAGSRRPAAPFVILEWS
ncbi:Threonine dehydrogenase [Parafrankia irregularis]|uniref:Threonine dehydrogenase n=1 Tax=Parafrankia irregularis TaxID=795642 RepID=A0A0S4QY91_9ACTN|nr:MULTISPECIES: hypothetical protein [Frankiaceae]MBE3204671.1 hypothetical protein [Parafrankia sp. CH37]CUU60609.1 Threonine dehydrogenase [Parafrankia irregularis]